ncbi:hypothetical protein BDW66DRAFT_159315 [Aspergillus desertorum]
MADMPAPIFSPTTASTITVPPRRDDRPLRSSCGECNQAKVKCSKDRPTCRRCALRNTNCVYGISLRGIKRQRPRQQADQACLPKEKKRHVSLPSPVFSRTLPAAAVNTPVQPTCMRDLGSSDIYPEGVVDDDLEGLLSMNPFDASLPDPTAFPFPLGLSEPHSNPPIQPSVAPQKVLDTMTVPLSPISPPSSRDGHSHLGATVPTTTTTPGLNSPVPVPVTCWCQQSISFKLTELSMPKPPSATFILEDFLTEHRANMALCTNVLNCTVPHHNPGMLLLTQIIALLHYMTAAFDQILLRGDTSGQQQQQQPQPPPPPPPPTPTSRSSPIDHRKEQITQANTLRAELAKLGVLIQEFDRRYCAIDNLGFGDAAFLLSPLFANLQWKTQAKFDARCQTCHVVHQAR